jgi:hypothetical protein
MVDTDLLDSRAEVDVGKLDIWEHDVGQRCVWTYGDRVAVASLVAVSSGVAVTVAVLCGR